MLPFDFIQNPLHTQIEYKMENQLEKLKNIKSIEYSSLLYTDVSIWMNIGFEPTKEWFQNRNEIIKEYSELNWIGLGEHLKNKTCPLSIYCYIIQENLNRLVNEIKISKKFTLYHFQSTLLKISNLWANLFKSYIEDISDISILNVLDKFGQL
jgi:hypothetical protein